MPQVFDLSRLSFPRFVLLFAALFALAALPVLLCDTLPLFDYPNHLARMHILLAWPRSDALQRFYEIVWRPVPNLAMDITVPLLARLMPLAWAGKGFVLLTLLLLAGGVALLHRVLFGRWSAWPGLAFLLLYSRAFLRGFVNYLFGLGLGFIGFALWMALRRRPLAVRVVVGALLSLLIFFAHLLAWGLYGVMVVGYEAGLVFQKRPKPSRAIAELALAAGTLLPALGIFLLATPHPAYEVVAFARWVRKIDLLFSVFDNYNRPLDIACFVIGAVALVTAFWRRWVRLEPSIVAPLALLTATYLVTPSQLFSGAEADHRIPLLLGLVVIGGSHWVASSRRQSIFLGAALLMFVLRMTVVTINWRADDRIYASLMPAFDQIPIGSRVAVAYPPGALTFDTTPLAHFPTLAIVRRDAFVPTLFAYPTQQPVAIRPPYRDFSQRLPPEKLWARFVTAASPLDEDGRAVLATYDYVMFVGPQPFTLLASRAIEPVFIAPRLALVRVLHAGVGLDARSQPR